jgi:capsular polysaccharide transport system permease protein
LLLFETRTTLELDKIVQAWALMALLGLGVGTLNCFLWTMVPIWQRLWSIITRPLFIVSCIFFMFETVPAELRVYLWWNPLVHPIGMMRSAFYSSYDASYASPLYVVLLSLGCLLAGLLFLNRYNRDILHR